MPSPLEIDRLIADLSGHRQRLLEIVGPEGPGQNALMNELQELGEQLILADEELRVQQEELDDARLQLDQMATERNSLLQSSSVAQVLTDAAGLVRYTNRAADQLIMRPGARVVPRPIATWFAVADRAPVRALIGRMSAGKAHEDLDQVQIGRSDGSSALVSISVSQAPEPTSGQQVLRWELRGSSEVAAVPEPIDPLLLHSVAAVPTARSEGELVADLAAGAVEMAQLRTVEAVLDAVRDAAVRLVGGAENVSVALADRDDNPDLATHSDEVAQILQDAQVERRQGPTMEALRDLTTVAVDDLSQQRNLWPHFVRASTGIDVASVLAVPISLHSPQLKGVLTMYSRVPGAFDEDSRFAASMLVTHAAVALARTATETQLRQAVEHRQLIGEAVGVLIERHKITPEQAFENLVSISNRTNVKVRDLARAVVETGQNPGEIRAT
jgi:PAS domain S-box-containing protein